MKLNKSERHTAYILMVWEVENNYYETCGDRGICALIYDVFGLFVYIKGEFIKQFPELYAKRTRDDGYWFSKDKSGWQKRIELLKQCIIETY